MQYTGATSVTANLLDNGIVNTLVSVGATSVVTLVAIVSVSPQTDTKV